MDILTQYLHFTDKETERSVDLPSVTQLLVAEPGWKSFQCVLHYATGMGALGMQCETEREERARIAFPFIIKIWRKCDIWKGS